MAIPNSAPMRFTPLGLADAYDSTNKFPGACQALTNLVFDQSNPELVISKPGTVKLGNADFVAAGFITPGFISVQISIGTRVFGMIATGRFAGKDEPFVYDTATGAFVAVGGVLIGIVPNSPSTVGDWTPPTIAMVGVVVAVTHPGFAGGANRFGWFDMTNPAAPVWHAGDTATNGLGGVPVTVANFNNRLWFGVANFELYCDVLTNPPTRTAATQGLTIGDNSPINASAGLPIQTTSSGILAVLTVFKQTQIWQIAGDTTTSNLSLNFVSLNIGTPAPRSIAQSPLGLYFMAAGGPYYIDQLGTLRPLTYNLDQLEPDIQVPFQNATTPTRWAAAYATNIYRICGPTTVGGVAGTNDYWFDEHKRRWTGPHTFAYDCASPLAGYFVLSSKLNPAVLMQNTAIQTLTSVFTDMGTVVRVNLQSATFPKAGEMCMKQVAESQIELAAAGGTVTYTIIAQDEQGIELGQGDITVNAGIGFWGATVWGSLSQGGSGNIWQSLIRVPHTYPVPWAAPLVFEKMQLQIQAVASVNIIIGTFYARYQKTGYMTLGNFDL
jgi:hypothetical protein